MFPRLTTLVLLAAALAGPPALAAEEQPVSAAEKLLFMSDQLGTLSRPHVLRYAFRKSGTLEPGFDDSVTLEVSSAAGGGCCNAHGEFLTGARRLALPDIENAAGNPVLMFFLERDVREMQRHTRGSQNHFRRLIRLALADGAAPREVNLGYKGRPVRGREVVINPFRDDPSRNRYEKLAAKEYRFWFSDDVPGGLFGIRTTAAGAAGAAPLLVEELFIDGAWTSEGVPAAAGK